jgi:hypothetical protein
LYSTHVIYMIFLFLQKRDERIDLIPRQVYECDKLVSANVIKVDFDPRSSWASGVFDLQSSNSDPLVPGLLDRLPAEDRDAIDRRKRQEKRQPAIFSLYPAQDEEDQVERRLIPDLPQESFSHRIHVKVSTLLDRLID